MKLTAKTLNIISISCLVAGAVIVLLYRSKEIETTNHHAIRMIGYVLMWTGLILTGVAYWKRPHGERWWD